MPDAARTVSGIPRADPGGRVTPRFWHRLNRFRHFCGGSLALASLDRACWDLVPAFPQRSPPRLLTAAACGGLRSAPDYRTRRALLHLSYSCASPVLMAMLVTHDPQPTYDPSSKRYAISVYGRLFTCRSGTVSANSAGARDAANCRLARKARHVRVRPAFCRKPHRFFGPSRPDRSAFERPRAAAWG